MSLYDDLDAIKEKADQVAGWSSGIKLFQTQLQLKKTAQAQAKRDQSRKPGAVLPPVIDLKSRKEEDESNAIPGFGNKESGGKAVGPTNSQSAPSAEIEWNGNEEYDPLWPNDYEKVVKELRERREREREREDEERRRKHKEERDKRTRESFLMYDRFDEERRKTGFGGRKGSEEEDEEEEEEPMGSNGDGAEVEKRMVGVAIAPPPSLQEGDGNSGEGDAGGLGFDGSRQSFTGEGYGMGLGGSVAAKIMAKYGFKEGQGLGKQEQGISMALQVEKTSKRGGRIISEKDIMPPPVMGGTPPPLMVGPPSGNMPPPAAMPPPPAAVMGAPGAPGAAASLAAQTPKPEPTITEMMKNPSKVVLLRNMVGPGEVDEDLEPEVKEECNTKYGDVIRVLIFEMPNVPHDEAVRIFVEFKRIESAIKAVVDLNGRYFGGRQVKAGFYLWEKLNNLELAD